MSRLIAYSPLGKPIIGSFERVDGCALAEVFKEKSDSPIEVEYQGETKIWWDTQTQVRADSRNIDSEKLWVCEEHNIWADSELTWKEEK